MGGASSTKEFSSYSPYNLTTQPINPAESAEREPYNNVLKSVEKGKKGAKTKLAWYLISGLDGAQVDPKRAVALLEEQVKKNDSAAMWILGVCKEYGIGTERDLQKAVALYDRSRDKKNTLGALLSRQCACQNGTKKVFLGMREGFKPLIDQLWKVMYITPFLSLMLPTMKIEDEQVATLSDLLKQNSSVEELIMSPCVGDQGASLLSEMLRVNSTLNSLFLWSCDIGDEGAEKLGEAVMEHTGLTRLSLSTQKCGAKGFSSFFECLKKNTLTRLDIHGCDMGEAVTKLAEALMINTSLISLDIGYNELREEDTDMIAKALETNSTLTELNLRSNMYAPRVFKCLSSNSTLTKLDLSGSLLGAFLHPPKLMNEEVTEGLINNVALTELILDENQVGDKGACMIGEGLRVNSTLTALHLRSCSISDEGALAIAESLKKNSTLTVLFLGSNGIEDDGGIGMGDALKINTTLTSLNLGDNKIGDKGAAKLSEAIRINTTLSLLILGHNYINDIGAAKLVDALNSNTTLTEMSYLY